MQLQPLPKAHGTQANSTTVADNLLSSNEITAFKVDKTMTLKAANFQQVRQLPATELRVWLHRGGLREREILRIFVRTGGRESHETIREPLILRGYEKDDIMRGAAVGGMSYGLGPDIRAVRGALSDN